MSKKKQSEEPKKPCITWTMLDEIIESVDDISEKYGFQIGVLTADLNKRETKITFEETENEE